MKYNITKDHEKLLLIYDNDIDNNIIEYKNLYDLLSETKKKIDKYGNNWDRFKKKAHNYEYIYSSSSYKKNVCSINPVASRSYFKIIEILQDNNINKNYKNILCVAEGPGGFLQYLVNYYINNIYGITLLSKDNNIPFWSPIILNNKNIKLLKGLENDGNIYKLNNIESFCENIKKCDLITSDGGIDFSSNYNNQEVLSYQLLYCEIYLALNVQEEGGNFIIKFFDILYYNTLQLLYLLYLSYEEIVIIKPHTSRLSNSEKYIVCKNFKNNNKVIELLKTYFNNYNKLYIYIPISFINEIKLINTNYINLQIKNIEYIINSINSINNINSMNSINNYKHNYNYQIKLAKEWCIKYNVQINNIFK